MASYIETIEFLYKIRLFGSKLGLESMEALLELVGNPHHSLKFIHVAGTNGKGSACAFLSSILQKGGYKTGLYTSPHLVSFCERIQVNRQPISEEQVVRLVDELKPHMTHVEQQPGKRAPTFFEVVTAMALLHFRDEKVDVVVWETGMGGRLDATNVVLPEVSVITNIDFDHMQYLGDTLAKIAFEKAGIIKANRPVVTAVSDPTAFKVIEETALKLNSQIIQIGNATSGKQLKETAVGQVFELAGTCQDYGVLETPLLGEHQVTNAALAVTALEALPSGTFHMSTSAVREGIRAASWPGRLQYYPHHKPALFIDGAHNPASAKIFHDTCRKHFNDLRRVLILGILKDKNYREMLQYFVPVADEIFFVKVKSERSADPQELFRICKDLNSSLKGHVCADFNTAYQPAASSCLSSQNSLLMITGSLYLVGEAFKELNLSIPRRGIDQELTMQ